MCVCIYGMCIHAYEYILIYIYTYTRKVQTYAYEHTLMDLNLRTEAKPGLLRFRPKPPLRCTEAPKARNYTFIHEPQTAKPLT